MLFLAAIVALDGGVLWRSFNLPAAYLNDYVLHVSDAETARDSIVAGGSWTDFWIPHMELGYPAFHHYQHLGHVAAALLSVATGASVEATVRWLSFALIITFPLTVYAGGRMLGMGQVAACCAAALAPWLSTEGLYGVEYDSYLWRSWGLYTQIWGAWLLPLAWGASYRFVTCARSPASLRPRPPSSAACAAILAATWLAHLVYGYMAFLNLGLFAVVDGPRAVLRRVARAAWLAALTLGAAAYFLFWLLKDGAYAQWSQWEKPEKYLGYGAAGVLSRLLHGELFDYGRWPLLTILAVLGLALACHRWRTPLYRTLAALFVFWLLLYFGRATWGRFYVVVPSTPDLAPAASAFPIHRFLAGVQLGGLWLAGEALAWGHGLLSSAQLRHTTGTPAAPRALTMPSIVLLMAFAALLGGLAWQPASYAATDARWIREQRQADADEDGQDARQALDLVAAQPPGRAYAGLPATWGGSYRVGQAHLFDDLAARRLDTLGFLYQIAFVPDVQMFFDDTNPIHYNLFNVRYVVAPDDFRSPGFLRPLGRFGRHTVYVAETTGYFDVVRADVGFQGSVGEVLKASEAWLASPLPAAKQHPRVDLGPPPTVLGREPLAHLGLALQDPEMVRRPPQATLTGETVERGQYAVDVVTDEDAYAMLKVTYHPGWKAWVDGQPAPVELLLPKYLGVALPAGRHHVELRYQPSPWRPVVASAGALLLALVFVAERLLARRRLAAQVDHPVAVLDGPPQDGVGQAQAPLVREA